MRITKIVINNYRAFYNESGRERTKHVLELKNGKNLLIYGENGSGKSSFYKALRDLFESSVKPRLPLIQNVFSKQQELQEEPFIEVTLSEDDTGDRVFRLSGDPALVTTSADLLRSVARTRSFMTYRDLLRVHFVRDPVINLFDFLFQEDEGLLADIPNPESSSTETRLKMSELLGVVTRTPDDTNIKDFTAGVNQILSELKDTLNKLLLYFDQSLQVNFSSLTEQSVRAGKPEIKLNVKYFGVDLGGESEQYHHFLNEARLSALSICIFLAAHLSVPPPEYKILFLDDIFTGLDMSNRIPLLDIITDRLIRDTGGKTFADNQIFLTTYDRQWYELARNILNKSSWHFLEMFIDHHSRSFDQPDWKPGEDDLEIANYYFRHKQYPSCANYQRKICEGLIRRFLPERMRYDVLDNGEIKPINKLRSFIDRLVKYLEEVGLSATPFAKLDTCLRVVMNPMSHDDLDSPVYKRELEVVFAIIEELKKLKNEELLPAGNEIVMKKMNPVTGQERTYVSELTSPLRKITSGSGVKIIPCGILPLIEKEGDKKTRISYEGDFFTVYGMFCHSLQIQKAPDPYSEFTFNGTPLSQIIAKS